MKDFDPEPYARGIRDLNERERAAIARRAAMDAVAGSAFKVDLVQLELLPEGARRAVVSGGVVLFAAEGGP